MPPHCDSWDGPVVQAALRALQQGDVDVVLPYVPEDAEEEVRSGFERARTFGASGDPDDVATDWFCETVVRVHRAGEGAAFTGLKPAGLDHGPAVPLAEQSIAAGDPRDISELLATTLLERIEEKFNLVMRLQEQRDGSVVREREYVEAMLGFQVWSHKTYECISAELSHGHVHAQVEGDG